MGVGAIRLTQDSGLWCVLVKTETYFLVPNMASRSFSV